MHIEIKEQSIAIKELTASLKYENILKEPLKCLGNHIRENYLEFFTLIKEQRENTKIEMDKLVKGIKQMIEAEKFYNFTVVRGLLNG